MRSPDRLPRLAEKLLRAWSLVPDWRLGQLIANLAGTGDSFYLEDSELEELLDRFIAERTPQ